MQPSGFLQSAKTVAPRWDGQIWLSAVQITLSLILLSPIAVIFVLAVGDSSDLMAHLIATVLPLYIGNTLLLMVGVGSVAVITGVSTAWIVSRYDFPWRRLLALMLILPAAIPAYIIAYAYTGFLEYAGPVQSGLRHIFGFTSSRDYWFPQIRSLGGAIFVMGFVLYPYVFLFAKSGFGLISSRMFEIGLMSGRNLFTTVALPFGRPAIIAGLALVLMEVVADFGTVDFFAVETISLGVFNVWLGMNNITAAAQLSVLALLLVVGLLLAESYGRRKSGLGHPPSGKTGVPRRQATGVMRVVLPVVCLVPVVIGFVIPFLVLVQFSLADFINSGGNYNYSYRQILNAVYYTLTAAGIGVVVISASGMLIGIIAVFIPLRLGRLLASMSAVGYAIPGTILALGVLGLSQSMSGIWAAIFHPLGLLTASLPLLLLAYAVRFQVIGFGACLAASQHMPPTLIPASRVMGHGFVPSMQRITIPLIRPTMFVAAVLIFVDIVKELPLTLLLRPIGFDTLAVITYQFAHNEQIEQAALPALIIVLTGIVPVLIIQHALNKDM